MYTYMFTLFIAFWYYTWGHQLESCKPVPTPQHFAYQLDDMFYMKTYEEQHGIIISIYIYIYIQY